MHNRLRQLIVGLCEAGKPDSASKLEQQADKFRWGEEKERDLCWAESKGATKDTLAGETLIRGFIWTSLDESHGYWQRIHRELTAGFIDTSRTSISIDEWSVAAQAYSRLSRTGTESLVWSYSTT